MSYHPVNLQSWASPPARIPSGWREVRLFDGELYAEQETVRVFLKQLASASQARYPAGGAGEDLRIEGEVVTGGALEHDGRMVHLAAYRIAPRSRTNAREGMSPMARSTYRRRLH